MRQARTLIVLVVLCAAIAAPAVAAETTGGSPGRCGPAQAHARMQCSAAVRSFSRQLGRGDRPYQRAWHGHSDAGIAAAEDPSCPRQRGAVSPCFAYYSAGGRYWFVSASVSRRQATAGRATIYGAFSYRRTWVRCRLGRGADRRPVPGRLVSNNGCGSGMPESDAYFVGVEMQGAQGRVHFTREVGWQFTGSGYLDAPFLDAVGLYRCTRGAQITCRDGAGDEFRYAR